MNLTSEDLTLLRALVVHRVKMLTELLSIPHQSEQLKQMQQLANKLEDETRMSQTHEEYAETTRVLADRVRKVRSNEQPNEVPLVVHEVLAEGKELAIARRAVAVYRSLQQSQHVTAEVFYHVLASMEEKAR